MGIGMFGLVVYDAGRKECAMSLMKGFCSKKFFVFNLVLLGAMFGFALSFLSFSCANPGKTGVKAQGFTDAPGSPAAFNISPPMDALAVAEGLQNAFRFVADKAQPSVVEIKTETVQRRTIPNLDGIPWEFFFGPRDRSDSTPRSKEREFRSQGLGSGIIVRQKNGAYYALTNNHVVDGVDKDKIIVVSSAGKEYQAELVGQDDRKDLAMISFRTKDEFPLAELGDSDAVRAGDWAIAVGSPLGFMSSVTMGIVSAVGRTGGPGGNINDFIQTDAAINQGNSGGALVNIMGEVIGINTWIASNNGGSSIGLGFAIPINNAKRSIDDFIDKGKTSYGWLGVSLIDVDKDLAQALGLEGKRGALTVNVFLGSPGDKGGIRAGDFITHVNGREARDRNQVTLMVGDLKPGEKAEFTVIRDGVEQKFRVTIDPRDDKVASDYKKLWPGVIVAPVTGSLRKVLELGDSAEGLAAVQVEAGSPAAVVGLQRGDIITAINETPVKDAAAFYKALREKTSKELWFGFVRGGTELESLKYKR